MTTARETGNGALAGMDQVAFEQTLRVGDVVEARWTNSYSSYAERARVVRVNRASVRVEIIKPTSYLFGRSIPVPLLTRTTWERWSVNNCVAPLRGE